MSTQAPEIDGVTLINDFEGGEPQPGRDARGCASPKRTITIWWGRCWLRRPRRLEMRPQRRSVGAQHSGCKFTVRRLIMSR